MAFNLESLSTEAVLKAPRIILVGVEKIGKTTFACGSRVEGGRVVEYGLNKPVVVSIGLEQGADALPVPKFPQAHGIEDIMEALGSLYREDHKFGTVVLDSASALQPLIKAQVQKENKELSTDLAFDQFNRGVNLSMTHWQHLMRGLDALRDTKSMSSIIVCHAKPKTVKVPDADPYDAYVCDLPDAIANSLFRWADVILFANAKIVTRKEDAGFGKEQRRAVDAASGNRYLYTQKEPSHPGGGRGVYGQLPREMPLDWAAFMAAVKNAM